MINVIYMIIDQLVFINGAIQNVSNTVLGALFERKLLYDTDWKNITFLLPI